MIEGWKFDKLQRIAYIGRDEMANDKQLAYEHWLWLGRMLEKMYKDAFVHGFKHGVESVTGEE